MVSLFRERPEEPGDPRYAPIRPDSGEIDPFDNNRPIAGNHAPVEINIAMVARDPNAARGF
jgi:hypothetical protein